jgi:hypothetical protein
MGPTVVTLQLPLTPQQAMIAVAAEHAPALLAIDPVMTLSDQHLRGRGLATFTNVERLTDVINGLRDPEREELERWNPVADCLLFKAVHDQQMDGRQVNWLEVADAVGRDASECAARWAIGGWGVGQPRGGCAGANRPREATPGTRVGPDSGPEWTQAEDERLGWLVAGRIDWNDLVLRMGGRLGDGCRDHFLEL